MSAEREDEVIRLNFRLYREDNPALFDALVARDPRKRARYVRLLLDRGYFVDERHEVAGPVQSEPRQITAVPPSSTTTRSGSAFDELDADALLEFSLQ